jgi:hypothetical protein
MYRFGCVELKINLCPIQAPATKPSGCAGEFRYFFEEEVKKSSLFGFMYSKKKLLNRREVPV